jgi:hypothetical protein
MDELFGNLIYLLPIALVIIRIISAAGDSKKKPPSRPVRPAEPRHVEDISGPNTPKPGTTGQAGKRIILQEDMDPGMREFLDRFGIKPVPAAPKPAPARKKAAKEKPVPPKKEQPLFAETRDTPKQAEQTVEPAAVPGLPKGFSPLQQGFLWAEILGPAKAMRD